MIEEVLGIISDVHPAGCRTMGRAMAEADLCDVLPSIHVPTLLLDGNADRRAPVSLAEERAAQIPSSRLVVIPDAGHESNLEASDRFNAEVRELLGSQARGS